ncbi:Autophagy protein 5 [Sporothrix stenoceras]|uniref:Autophagy protein 5 n=1 Tax=Sporothrix stenoceras TaxID=5173 RepID=A0ABR3ZMP9_9PEZI
MAASSIRGFGRSGTSSTRPGDSSAPALTSLARALWQRRVPLIITHAALGSPDDGEAAVAGGGGSGVGGKDGETKKLPPFYATSVPRFGYLAQLLPRLAAFFGRPCSSFHYEDVPLRNLPVGLLLDLYRPVTLQADAAGQPEAIGGHMTPWRLVVADGENWHLADTFLNGAKEADYVRYGSAKQIMSLSKANTEALWHAVQDNDYVAFSRVNNLLLNAPTPLRHIPLRLYIPTTAPPAETTDNAAAAASPAPSAPGTYKVMQALVQPRTSNRQPQTLGPALRSLLPLLFPSSRDQVLANVILHGAPVPFQAPLEELMREAAYPDGWLCLIVVLL